MLKGRSLRGLIAVLAIAVLAIVAGGRVHEERQREAGIFSSAAEKMGEGEVERDSPGGEATGGEGGESAELVAQKEQWDNARTAPSGIVAPGAYSAAFSSLQSLSATSGSWSEVTRTKYDADDPDYRDYYSNSSGGSGLVTGRITGLT